MFSSLKVHLEIWQVVAICILMVPAFLVANYIIVKKAAMKRRRSEELMERAVAMSVNKSMGATRSSGDRFKPKPRFGKKQKL
jgi:hypothetical protein